MSGAAGSEGRANEASGVSSLFARAAMARQATTASRVVPQLALDGYFARVGLDKSDPRLREPSVATLERIVAAHAAAIPFENLDVLLGHGVSLNPEAVERKLIGARRGGYCFEQNGLLLAALHAIGFEATPHAGRVRLQWPATELPPRTHMFLRVMVDGDAWLADVGVGGLTPSRPLRMDEANPQPTPHGDHRVLRRGDILVHQAFVDDPHGGPEHGPSWIDVYESTGEPMAPIDQEVANWWTSTSPRAKFSQNILVAMARGEGVRVTLHNRRFVRRKGGRVVEQREWSDPDELLALLRVEFDLPFEPGTRFGGPNAPWYRG
jgi:N-hydroxyarylamine O-acetyltransferase